MDTYFILYPSCIPVKGSKNLLLCDSQRSQYVSLPVGFMELFNNQPIAIIKKHYDTAIQSEIDKIYSWLIDIEFGFYTNHPQNFEPINLTYLDPSLLTNAIIDFSSESTYSIQKVMSELDYLGARAIQIRFFNMTSILDVLNDINIQYNRVRSIEIISQYPSNDIEEIIKKIVSIKLINHVVFYNSDCFDVLEQENCTINYIKDKSISKHNCGQINTELFNLDIRHIAEATKHNTCLNQKIGIDVDGSIKNCPSMKLSFGNVTNKSLFEVATESGFQKQWNISKDKVEACKDCEFRLICTDCRAYLEEPGNLYSKPLKCGYDPNLGVWADWSSNPLKFKAMDYYGFKS